MAKWERLIGTLRRECLDQIIVFDEAHLRRTLCAYATYYNQTRTHLTLNKDAPIYNAWSNASVKSLPFRF
jgi:transposase InsO family protein